MINRIEPLSFKHGLMLVADDPDFLSCCMKCEVAASLGSVEACPQRLHTSNSCCSSCGLFLEHGKDAMLSHWQDHAQFMAAFQVVIPFNANITEKDIREVFHLQKVTSTHLSLTFEWQNKRVLDIHFSKDISWVMTVRHNYWPIDLNEPFLRDGLIYGLAGLTEHAGARLFSDLKNLIKDFVSWLSKSYNIEFTALFKHQSSFEKNLTSYFVSYFLQFQNSDNLVIEVVIPDYEQSTDSEVCLIRSEEMNKAFSTFSNITHALILQTELLTFWDTVEPTLHQSLDQLALITRKIQQLQLTIPVSELNDLLDQVQSIRIKLMAVKPTISRLPGTLAPYMAVLSDPLIETILTQFNLTLLNSWLDFARSVEQSVIGVNTYIQSKLNLLTYSQEKKIRRRMDWIVVFFASITGIATAVNFVVLLFVWLGIDQLKPIVDAWGPYGALALFIITGAIIFYLYREFYTER
jgi:hypothetical protein